MAELVIKNHDEIIEKLTEMLMQFDKDCNGYQTDIYLYYNEEEQTAELDTYVNVGGNSWLNDNHYTIYSDKEHFENYFDWYQEKQEFIDVLEISKDELEKDMREYYEMSDDESLSYSDYKDFLSKSNVYTEKLQTTYNDYIDETKPEYVERAEIIMQQFYLEKGFKEGNA